MRTSLNILLLAAYMALFAAMLLSFNGCATLHRMQADVDYENMSWNASAQHYNRYLARREDPEVLPRLADCYRKMGDVLNAEATYAKLVESPWARPEHRLYYGQALMQNGKYDLAKRAFDEYLMWAGEDEMAEALLASCDSIVQFKEDSALYSVSKLPGPLNTEASNFSPAFLEEGIVFTSERTDRNAPRISKWNGQPYMDLYYAEKGENGVWVRPIKLEGKVDGIYHEGPLAITHDGKTMYFTRSNYLRRNRARSEEYVNNLKVYSAQLVDGKWDQIQELPFNNDEFSCGHPALSPDGNRLYFVSDREGGYGGTDLYYTDREGGQWGAMHNAGPTLNTAGNEMFPWMAPDGMLYFASDGHPGLGGLDIFSALPMAAQWSTPVNLKYPINSSRDDFGYILADDGQNGYFSSSRDRINGVDDLYSFQKVAPMFSLDGIVVAKSTQLPLGHALVELRNEAGQVIAEVTTGPDGTFHFPLQAKATYTVYAGREGFFADRSAPITTKGRKKSANLFVKLELDQIVIGKPIVLENIYYDFDKWNIRPDAEPELNHLAQVLKDNPSIYIELGSHADSRGTDRYNETLAQKRAQSAVDYIVRQGIASERIRAKGYGESQPVNQCKDHVACTEEEHQMNRRTEFKVVKIE